MRVSVLLFATLATLLGCDSDSTAPPITGEVRIAHAAPGTGAFSVALDGEVLTPSLELGQAVGMFVDEGDHSVELTAGAERTTLTVRTDRDAVGVLIMGGDSPTPRLYPHTHFGAGGRIKIINAVPDRRLGMSLSGDGASVSVVNLAFTDAFDSDIPPDTYEVTVSGDDLDEPVELENVVLSAGRIFVVIHPAGDGSGSLRLMTF